MIVKEKRILQSHIKEHFNTNQNNHFSLLHDYFSLAFSRRNLTLKTQYLILLYFTDQIYSQMG